MQESSSNPETKNFEVFTTQLIVAPAELDVTQNKINSELQILKAQRAFTVAAFALRELTEYVPEGFDTVAKRVAAEAALSGSELEGIELFAELKRADGTKIVDAPDGIEVEAFNPDSPNRVLLTGYDYSECGPDDDPTERFWALADLDQPEAAIEVFMLKDLATTPNQITANLYDQLYANE